MSLTPEEVKAASKAAQERAEKQESELKEALDAEMRERGQ